MKLRKSSIVVMLGALFALIVLSLFILRASLDLMNQRSDVSLIIGITGVAITIFLWGLLITRLVKIAGSRKYNTTEGED